MKLKPLTPSELNEAIARIAEEFYGRSHVSPVELVRASGYLEGRASVTVEAVEAALAAHPSWVTAWLTYSADKRTRSERMQDRAVGELNLSERTAHHMRTVLGTALALALRDGLVMRNVASLARPRPVPHSERTVLNPDEVAALVAGLRGDRLEALLSLRLPAVYARANCLDCAGRMWTLRMASCGSLVRYSGSQAAS